MLETINLAQFAEVEHTQQAAIVQVAPIAWLEHTALHQELLLGPLVFLVQVELGQIKLEVTPLAFAHFAQLEPTPLLLLQTTQPHAHTAFLGAFQLHWVLIPHQAVSFVEGEPTPLNMEQ